MLQKLTSKVCVEQCLETLFYARDKAIAFVKFLCTSVSFRSHVIL